MITSIKKYEIWVFLVLGPLLNIFFVLLRTKGFMSQSIYVTGRFCFLLFILLCLLTFTKGIKGLKDLFGPMLNWKVHPKWYILGIIFPVVVALITLLIKGFVDDLEYSSFITFTTTTFRGYVANFIWALIGEVVWVSYCMHKLSKIVKPFYAGQIVGIFWALWLVPIILLGEGIFPNIPIASAFVLRLGVAGMCAFIYTRTKSSICVLALQYTLSLTLLSLPITPNNGGATTYTIFGVVYFITMLGIWYVNYLIKKSY